MFKKIFMLTAILVLSSCGGGGEKAKELLEKILQFVGIPSEIVINICQDIDNNGICGNDELLTKFTINQNEDLKDIWQKIKLEDGKYILETADPTLPILVELQDENVKFDDGKFTLHFNGFKTDIKEISILEAMIDANFLRVEDVIKIRNLSDQEALDMYYSNLLHDLERNLNKLREKNLTSRQAVFESLRYMSKELLNSGIDSKIPEELESCNGDSTCIDNILTPLYEELLITEAEAEEIKIKVNTPTTLKGTIKEALTQKPLENVTITLYLNGEVVREIQSNSDGEYIFEDIAENYNYYLKLSKTGYLDINYSNINILEHEIKYLETIFQIDEKFLGVGTATGTITNAIDGNGISGLVIYFRHGINNKTGDIVGTVVTQANGEYSTPNLDAGNYTAEISGEGYQTAYISIIVLGEEVNKNQNGTITPLLSDSEIRIVLNWGDYPLDLDSHLTGPLEDGSGRFHIYFASQNSPYVNLDVDDVDMYGPETITINKKIAGVYRYSVHNYSGETSSQKGDNYYRGLANSNAHVRVFNNKGLVYEAYVPNEEGTIWTVFTIEGHEVIPINKVHLPDYTIPYDKNFKLKQSTDICISELPSK